MKKRLTIKDKLIFTVLFLLDKSVESHDYFKNPRATEPYRLQSNMAQQYLTQIYNKDSVQRATKKVPQPGIKIDQEKSLIILTDPKIFKKTYYWQKFRLITKNKKWDGSWKMVIFDIPETSRKTRDLIRYHLKKLGFAMWQKSVWVTIFDIKEELDQVIQKACLEKYVVVLKVNSLGSLENRKLIEKLFDLKKIDKNYQDFIEYGRLAIRTKNKKQIKEAYDQFFKAITGDPGVPADFLSDQQIKNKSIVIFKQLIKLLT